MTGIVVDFFGSTDLHDLTGIHDGHTVCGTGHHAQIVGNQNSRRSQLHLNLLQKIQDLRLNGHIQRRGGFIRQQDFGIGCQRNGHDASLAHTAGEIIGIQLVSFMGVLDTHQLHEADDPVVDFLLGQLGFVNQNCLCNLLSDGDGGVQGSHGILKHKGKQLATEFSHIPLRILCNVHAVGNDPAALDSCRFRQQVHDGFAKHTLSAAGFSHDGQHFAGIKLEAHIPDSLHLSAGRINVHGKVFNSQ